LSDGSTYQELDTAYVERLALELVEHGIEAVAIVFLHSFTNPEAELAARAVLQKVAPSLRVSISSEVVPEIREFERASTTIANVYVQDLVERYLRDLERRLESIGFEGNFYLMLSSGGIATVETTVRHPVRLLESGPAAGALAANAYGLATGHPDLISFDMGGTTAKICVIDQGRPLIAHQFEVDRIYRFKKGSGLPIKIPVIELIEIGTGGGSIARVDALGLLKVGPDSSGADPGAVCYGRGGSQPTVTDANLILGYLDPAYFLGGRMSLELEKARQVIKEKIATPLGLSIEEAAWGIHQIANENMANAARVHSLERGKDPRRFPLFAFGGAGPVHAYRIGLSLGSPLLLAPLGAGVMSTVGFLLAPLAFDFVRSWPIQLDAIDWERANSLLTEMEAEGHALLTESGVPSYQISHHREVDMRYVGQGHEIRVPIPHGRLSKQRMNNIQSKFESVYRALYERAGPPVRLEILNWRGVSSGPKPEVRLQIRPAGGEGRGGLVTLGRKSLVTLERGGLVTLGLGDSWAKERGGEGSQDIDDVAQTLKGSRQAYFPEAGGFTSTPIYDRYLMRPGMSFNGPAIVEERESTAIVGPHSQCHIDEHHNLVVQMPTGEQ
jgi:N-methylhydantoinase A